MQSRGSIPMLNVDGMKEDSKSILCFVRGELYIQYRYGMQPCRSTVEDSRGSRTRSTRASMPTTAFDWTQSLRPQLALGLLCELDQSARRVCTCTVDWYSSEHIARCLGLQGTRIVVRISAVRNQKW